MNEHVRYERLMPETYLSEDTVTLAYTLSVEHLSEAVKGYFTVASV